MGQAVMTVPPDGTDADAGDAAAAPSPTPRSRDSAGRPLSQRPRDITGAPLPPGTPTPWRERLAVGDRETSLPPDDAIEEAQRLILGGAPFYAHEVLEGPWHLADPPDRDFWQGLAQLAVGLTHIQRGNAVGAATILRRAADKLTAYPDAYFGVGVRRLQAAARRLADRAERDGTASISASELELPLRD